MHTAVFEVFLYSLFMPSDHFAALREELESDPHSHLLGGRSCFQDWAFSKPDTHLSSASCIFSLHPHRELSERSSGSGSSGDTLQGLRLQWKHGPKALNALWSPAGKPMDMWTVGVPPNDREDGLLFPFPFPAIPDLLFQGRTVSRGSGAWLPGLVRISDARHQAAGVMEAVTCWNVCCREWEITRREKSLPCKGPAQTSQIWEWVIQVSSQIHSYLLVMVWTKA